MDDESIGTIEDFVGRIRSDSSGWPHAWFRGEPNGATPLLPKLYRETGHHENKLLQHFRIKAPILGGAQPTPDRGDTDQWLFLAQHVGLPTRLLDWTESALVALQFALVEDEPVVWMLNPIELNRLSVTDDKNVDDEFPLTWVVAAAGAPGNVGSLNIQGAWGHDALGADLPVSIIPTHTHLRMSVQRSCFTVHGKLKKSLSALVSDEIVRCYRIDPTARRRLRDDLRLLGVSHSTVFPDLDGLAKELSELY